MLTERFTRAVDYARDAHAGQTRKGTAVPYLSHLLGVSSLVLEYGGDEDQAIAGLLHDVVEDQGSHHEAIEREPYGERVARIVMRALMVAKSQRPRRARWSRSARTGKPGGGLHRTPEDAAG